MYKRYFLCPKRNRLKPLVPHNDVFHFEQSTLFSVRREWHSRTNSRRRYRKIDNTSLRLNTTWKIEARTTL